MIGPQPIPLTDPEIYAPSNNDSHQHQYTIPVEWRYLWSVVGETSGIHPLGEHPGGKEVVRLRCACGEEIGR